jgi:hypothetical protein
VIEGLVECRCRDSKTTIWIMFLVSSRIQRIPLRGQDVVIETDSNNTLLKQVDAFFPKRSSATKDIDMQ